MDLVAELESMAFREKEMEHLDVDELIAAPAPRKPFCAADHLQEFLLKLDGPLDSAERVRDIAGLATAPKIYQASADAGNDDSGNDSVNALFIKVSGSTRSKLDHWLSTEHPSHRPLFIAHKVARKDLCSHSLSPFLGLDATLPQHRPDTYAPPLPRQDEHPVWYFFYGTLADTDVLRRLLGDGPDDYYKLHPARVSGGRLEMWAHKYRALVDSDDRGAVVQGSAFLVQSAEHEEALRVYETNN
ncbi:hypothetical protein B0A48_13806 [Cryoendolithus antarcticus]|uniref:Putative gamma-glutamylcyclotransferase n=1 Tax=Cryoendolithus antarcticus TaxID=1507870 RepID=A0A1V8SMQ7_9PEZI|nr:hypothetical protein B0A48_13806 [Cryoendolithus antarcticus]